MGLTERMRSVFSWVTDFQVYFEKKVLLLLLLGFSAGLPFLLVFSTLSAWLRDDGISRTTIGFFSWIGITYSIKVFWAPVVDRVRLPILTPLLGQRRSWILIAQLGIMFGLVGMAFTGSLFSDYVTDPLHPDSNSVTQGITQMALFALCVAFASATQDIAIDAYRIEVAELNKQGVMSAAYIFGYRLALLAAGAGALYLADFWDWQIAYLSMAGLVFVGVFAVLIAPDVARKGGDKINEALPEVVWVSKKVAALPEFFQKVSRWFVFAVVSPFLEFFQREKRWALYLLLVVAIYRISDITMGVMANPFYLDMGFSKSEIASVTKIFGFAMTMIGSAVGGVIVVRLGVMKPLLAGAVLVAVTNLLFAVLAMHTEKSLAFLAFVISADNFSGGLANVAFIAFLSGLTSRTYTATQYALFSSLMTLPGKYIGGYSGVVVDGYGYDWFFIYAAVIGVPAILAIAWLLKKNPNVITPSEH